MMPLSVDLVLLIVDSRSPLLFWLLFVSLLYLFSIILPNPPLFLVMDVSHMVSKLRLPLPSFFSGFPSLLALVLFKLHPLSLHGLLGLVSSVVSMPHTKHTTRSRRKICQVHSQKALMRKITFMVDPFISYLSSSLIVCMSFHKLSLHLFIAPPCSRLCLSSCVFLYARFSPL